MAVPATALPFGLRHVKLTPINTDGTLGTPVQLPVSQTFTFAETEDFEELRGDDKVKAERGQGPTIDWELGAGGISMEAYQVLAGGTISETGTSPDVTKTFAKDAYSERPYFRVEGQAISDSGGDFHAVVFRCRATGDLNGEMSDGSFWITNASGRGYPDEANANRLYEFRQNETATTPTGTD